jgi:hypothetical protein
MGAVAFAPDRFSAGILKLDRYRGIRTAGVLGAILWPLIAVFRFVLATIFGFYG